MTVPLRNASDWFGGEPTPKPVSAKAVTRVPESKLRPTTLTRVLSSAGLAVQHFSVSEPAESTCCANRLVMLFRVIGAPLFRHHWNGITPTITSLSMVGVWNMVESWNTSLIAALAGATSEPVARLGVPVEDKLPLASQVVTLNEALP